MGYAIGFLVVLLVILVLVGLVVDRAVRANRGDEDDNVHPYLEEEDADRRREND